MVDRAEQIFTGPWLAELHLSLDSFLATQRLSAGHRWGLRLFLLAKQT